jgi:hypothetical protein
MSQSPRIATTFSGALRAPLSHVARGCGFRLDSLTRLTVRITRVGLPLLGLVGLELILGGVAVSSHGGMP